MRKIKMFSMVSVDGFFAGEDGNIDWHTVDDEFNKFALEVISTVDMLVFGRITYQLFESYWPTAAEDSNESPEDKQIADFINKAHKVVFSKSLTEVDWEGAELMHDIDPEVVKGWKQQDGKDIIIYGSGSVVAEMTNLGLIDEYNLMISPVILGMGKPLFEGLDISLKLKLLSSRVFKSNGNVLLSYAGN